jgi:hypothetical protein
MPEAGFTPLLLECGGSTPLSENGRHSEVMQARRPSLADDVRVLRNTQAPLILPGILSTAGHWDQSRGATFSVESFLGTVAAELR